MAEKRTPSELEAAVEAACEEYYDQNARWTVLGSMNISPCEKDRILYTMRSMYLSWLDRCSTPSGHFIKALLDNDLKNTVNYADELDMRCFKLYVWFKYNEMNKTILYKD